MARIQRRQRNERRLNGILRLQRNKLLLLRITTCLGRSQSMCLTTKCLRQRMMRTCQLIFGYQKITPTTFSPPVENKYLNCYLCCSVALKHKEGRKLVLLRDFLYKEGIYFTMKSATEIKNWMGKNIGGITS
jgi:hypothetical protein